MSDNRQRLVITLGDPLSVNVELLAATLESLARAPFPTILVGSRGHFDAQWQRLGQPELAIRSISALDTKDLGAGTLAFFDVDPAYHGTASEQLSEVERGAVAVRSLESLRALTDWQGSLAVVTMPIDKHACHQAHFPYPAQTEFFTDLWRGEGIMILAGPRLRVGLVTNHLALCDVAPALSIELIEAKIQAFAATLRAVFQIERPRIGVCGLNPHASDHGLFGNEEERVISPALAKVKGRGVNFDIVGPLPADTAFFRAYEGGYDGVLAMYHDQGLGPLKTVHFHDAVNITGGLVHFRVSPDHGPARDLYLKGEARPDSTVAAIGHACRYLGWIKEDRHEQP